MEKILEMSIWNSSLLRLFQSNPNIEHKGKISKKELKKEVSDLIRRSWYGKHGFLFNILDF
jgi:hypothetical protein